MTASVVQILSGYGNNIVANIRSNLASTGTNATGKTSSSIKYTVTEEGQVITLFVFGREFVSTVETGRGPRRTTTYYAVSSNIRKWMDAKGAGIGLSEIKKAALARFITYRINKYGSKLYRDGGRGDIISNVVNGSLVSTITLAVLEAQAIKAMDEIEKTFK